MEINGESYTQNAHVLRRLVAMGHKSNGKQ